MIEDILSRLEKVKRTGRNNWLACCPAHDDKNPSLTLTHGENGGVVARCHSHQCDISAIVHAVGLGWAPWFPPKAPSDYDFRGPIRRPFPAADVLEALALECRIVAIVAEGIEKGEDVPEIDRERMRVAIMRIREAGEVARG